MVEDSKGRIWDYVVCLFKLFEHLEKVFGIQFYGGVGSEEQSCVWQRVPWALLVIWGTEYAPRGRNPKCKLLPPFSQ